MIHQKITQLLKTIALVAVSLSICVQAFGATDTTPVPSIAKENVQELANLLRDRTPHKTAKKKKRPALSYNTKQAHKHQQSKEKQAQQKEQLLQKSIQQSPAHKTIQQAFAATVAGLGYPAVSYALTDGITLEQELQQLQPDNTHDARIAWWLSRPSKAYKGGLLKKLHRITMGNSLPSSGHSMLSAAHTLLYCCNMQSLAKINSGIMVVPTATGCLLFDLARVLTGEITVKRPGHPRPYTVSDIANCQSTEWKNLLCALKATAEQLIDDTKLHTPPSRAANLATSISNFYASHPGNRGAAISKVTHRKFAKARQQSEGSATQDANILFDNVFEHFSSLTEEQRMELLRSAAQDTNVRYIAEHLIHAIEEIQTIDNQQNRLTQMKALQDQLSDAHDAHDPNDPAKRRTLMHCILRNADGARKKANPLAPREDTVRGLLMLIAAGATTNVNSQFTNSLGFAQQSCGVSEASGRSRRYINAHDEQTRAPYRTGAAFTYVGETPIESLTGSTIYVAQQTAALRTMCDLCEYAIGKTGKHTKQAEKLKQHLLTTDPETGPTTIAKLKASRVDEYLTQLTTALSRLSQENAASLLEFVSTAPNDVRNRVQAAIADGSIWTRTQP